MEVRIKRLNELAVVPTIAKDGDAGMDITATSRHYDKDGNVVFGTGLAFEIPKGYVGFLFPRSSNAKKDLVLTNSVGVVDSGYRGEVTFKFKPSAFFSDDSFEESNDSEDFECVRLPLGYDGDDYAYGFNTYDVGDRIGQIIIMPVPEFSFVEVDELSETERGTGGYGSSGK